ncbi:hypothetical protein [Leuconostoc mesenteroides]|uniref:hypothetical protein n=1 Tax=Leuconostoc mesenteroides TaxID=1245 RepID=UPI001CC0A5D6|nr:hypothetical protein [Leuconostoc mesenteroides]MBZ1502973.1 hypothetical protein [Leuconostoc mesenteroides]
MFEKGNRVNAIYPTVLGIVLITVAKVLDLSASMKGYENILESIIQLAGLVIGFYTAMYGVILVAGHTELLRKFKAEGVEGIFKKNLTSSLTVSFVIFIISVIMQELRFHQSISLVGFYIWIFFVGMFIGTSYRSIRLLLKMLFVTDDDLKSVQMTTHKESAEEKEKRLAKINKTD